MNIPHGPVAYLTSEYPKASHTFILREAEGLRALGIEVLTCSVRETDAKEHTGPEEKAAHQTTFYLQKYAKRPWNLLRDHASIFASSPGRYLRTLWLALRTSAPGMTALLYQLFYFAESVVFARYLQRQGVQHLHTHFANSPCSVAVLASEVGEIPFSFTMHGPYVFFEAERWRLDEKIARASFVSCISHFCRSQGMIFSDQVHWPRMHIVHCGIDPGLYDRPRTDPPGKNLLFVGRLSGVKGVPVLLEAFARVHTQHPDAKLTLVGDGEDRESIETLADTLGLKGAVILTGYLSQEGVAEELAKADVFVLPSFAEGLPVVLMEALASRVPVVTTRIAGVAELVEDGVNGYLVPAGDIESLAEAVNKLLSDPDLRARMGEAGRQRVSEEFNISTECTRLAHLMSAYQNTKPPTSIRAPIPD